MKTGIEHIREHFNTMSGRTRKFLNHPTELNLVTALNGINYLEGLAFAATLAHIECESDVDLAAAMFDEAKFLRDWYYKIRSSK